MSSLSPVHTIGDQLIEALRLQRDLDRKAACEQAINLLRQVEINEQEQMIDHYTFQFSGGMRQRAMIAMALACDPDVLIVDEPTTALDVTTQAEIMDLIKRLQQSRGMAVPLITHDLGLVAEVADHVAVMRFGQLVEQGTVEELFTRPKSPYARDLLGATLKLEAPAPTRASVRQQTRPVLSVRNLNKSFGKVNWRGKMVHAVQDANLDLYPGDNLGVVGDVARAKPLLDG